MDAPALWAMLLLYLVVQLQEVAFNSSLPYLPGWAHHLCYNTQHLIISNKLHYRERP